MRLLLWLALALVLLVVTCSAALRLAGSGVGCTPWPACRVQAATTAVPDDAVPEWQHALRLTHRISATAAGVVFVFIVAFGFASWSSSQRVAGVLLLVLAAGLALVGRITPSQWPAVVLANLLGGHLLLGALAWLLSPAPRPVDATAPPRWIGWPLCAGLLLLLASGGLVSARGADAACASGCDATDWRAWWEGLSAWRLWYDNSAWSVDAAAAMRRGTVLLHGTLGALAPLALALAAWRLRRRARAVAAASTLLASAVAVLGLQVVQQALQLPAAVAHSVLAGLTLAAGVALWRTQRR
jgi:heme A synthase